MVVVLVIAHRILVMKRSSMIEENNANSLIENPQHAYTRMLMDSTPRLMRNSCCELTKRCMARRRIPPSGIELHSVLHIAKE